MFQNYSIIGFHDMYPVAGAAIRAFRLALGI
jgi:hypothetical protein